MRARRALICDAVQILADGKMNLLGVFDKFVMTTELPADLPTFAFYTLLVEEESGEFKTGVTRFGFDVVDRSENVIASVFSAIPPRPEGAERLDKVGLAMYLQVTGVRVKEYGRHRLRIMVDGEEIDDVPFGVEPRP